ncbi:MAG: hypothetical protein WBA43_13410 [Elainellaceae cyanobacterium]
MTSSRSRSTPPVSAIPPTPRSAAQTQPSSLVRGAVQQIERFANALAEVLNDITALEVNTMVVSTITGAKFLPEEAYQDLYAMYHSHGESSKYQPLRRSLQSSCKDCMQKMGMTSVNIVPDPNNPTDQPVVETLLSDGEFLRNLRKLSELEALMGGDRADQNNITDIIYAQTVIQLDGDVINRFHEQLFSDRLSAQDKEFLIHVHSEAVTSGESNWRELLKFLFDLVQRVILRPGHDTGRSQSPNDPI